MIDHPALASPATLVAAVDSDFDHGGSPRGGSTPDRHRRRPAGNRGNGCAGTVATAASACSKPPTPQTPSAPVDLEQLGEEIAELAAQLHAATYRLLVRLRDFDIGEGWNVGFQSCAQWLSWRTGIAPGAAREKVRVARALADLPRLGGAMELGELSYSKVRALTRIATPANEEELLELARHATTAQVETFVRAWRRVDRMAEAEQERERHEARYLTLSIDDDGSYVVRGRLDPEVGALLERALEAAEKSLCCRPGSNAAGSALDDEQVLKLLGGGRAAHHEPGLGPGLPTAPQRRADALGLLTEMALASEGRATAMPLGRAASVQVVLHVDAESLREDSESGQCVLAGGVRVPAETSRRLACDASRVVMTQAKDGTPLDVGRRTRTVPPSIRRALDHRDRGCRFPGCGNRFTDAHHLKHWADGGATRLDNLLLLCRRHHRAVHEEGFRVSRDSSGSFRFIRPDGRVLPHAPPVPVLPHAPPLPVLPHAPPLPVLSPRAVPGTMERCAEGELVAGDEGLRRLDTGRGARPGIPPGFGQRLDLDWAIRVLYRPTAGSAATH